MRFILAFAFAVLFMSSSVSAADEASFQKEVAPLLQRNCVACHGPEKAKGHFRLDTFDFLMKPGSSDKEPIVAGNPKASHLYQLLVEPNPDDRMPQKAQPLSASEIEVIRAWIASGAKFDGPSRAASLASYLPRPSHPPAPERYARPWPITALAFTGYGTELIASGCHELTLWNSTNGALLRRIGGMPERVHALATQPRGSLLAVAGGAPGLSGELMLIDLADSNAATSELAVTSDEMLCATFSPDGDRLAAGGTDRLIRLFNVKSGGETLRINQHSDWVHALAFSPDGKRLASASRDRTARVYNSDNGESASAFRDHEGAVEAVTFDPSGKMLYSAGTDHYIRRWKADDAENGKTFAKFDPTITAMSAGDGVLFAALSDGRIAERKMPDGNEVRVFHGAADRIAVLAHDAASQRLAAGSHDGRVRVWNIADGKLILDFMASPGIESLTVRR